MAFWQFKSIVTLIMTPLTLAQRIAGLTDKNYFVIKLLNYHSKFFYWSIVRPGRHAGGVCGRFPLNIKVRIDAYERQNHPLQSAEA